jgi:UDP-sugar transporter A1/2/3
MRDSPSMFSREQAPFTCAAALLMSLQPILVTWSKNPSGSFDYSVPCSTMLSEALKLGISAVLLLQQLLSGSLESVLHEGSVSEFFAYMMPSFIYFVNNNCIFFILLYVDPTTFQLLSQMKTIFTGLLFRVFLKRRLSAVQYLALVTLACGTACSQLPSGKHHGGGKHSAAHAAGHDGMAAPVIGGLLSLLSSLLSALGGIYNEKLLKGRPSASIHWQNIQMYVWGVAFNALGAWLKDRDAMLHREQGILSGFNASAWSVVVLNALNGLAISAVLKCARTPPPPHAGPFARPN